MLKLAAFIFFIFSAVKIFSQAGDFISVKKRNNRTVKTFFPGVPISFETFDKRPVSGMITSIRNDSVFVKEWDIRPVMTSFGIPVNDTITSYISGFHYKEIDKVAVSVRMKFQEVSAGRLLIIGGTGYVLLNVINGASQHQSITSSKNLTSLGIATGAVGLGLLINYLSRHANRYHVEYVHMNEIKKRGF